ncbi:MAG: acyltransferase family protein [Alphaproteobacteria bacterium]|nr:acyltransferase family protein [Alphaproteobacteria bacterium]
MNTRNYALDYIRATMMIVIVIAHGTLNYIKTKHTWGIENTEHHLIFDIILFYFVYPYVLPIFFIISGYFSALHLQKYGWKSSLVERIKRILIPLLVFAFICNALINLGFNLSNSLTNNYSNPCHLFLQYFKSGQFLFPIEIHHLWFLYYLFIINIIFMAINQIITAFIKKPFLDNLKKKLKLKCGFLMFIVFALLFISFYFVSHKAYLISPDHWIIDFPSLFIYSIFFGLGWVVAKTDSLENIISKKPILLIILSFILFGCFFVFQLKIKAILWLMCGLSALYSILLIFGIIGLFFKYFNQFSPKLNILSQSSYWIYLIHLPIIIFLFGFVSFIPKLIFIKFLVVSGLTLFLGLLSYRYLVKDTWINTFLSGKIKK